LRILILIALPHPVQRTFDCIEPFNLVEHSVCDELNDFDFHKLKNMVNFERIFSPRQGSLFVGKIIFASA